jgi:hypothetical protein
MARKQALLTLRDWGIPAGAPLAEAAALVVSEMVSNSVNASHWPGGLPRYDAQGNLLTLQLGLYSDVRRLLVAVWDQAPGCPLQPQVTPDATSGRGLAILDYYSDHHWDWAHMAGGKVVRCLLDSARIRELDA